MTDQEDQPFDREEAVTFARNFFEDGAPDELMEHWDKMGISSDISDLRDALKSNLHNLTTFQFDLAIKLAAMRIRKGILPDWLAPFAAAVLEGKRKRPPTPRGKSKNKNVLRNYYLSRAVSEVASRFDLPLYSNNELFEKTTAAEIVAEATNLSIDVVTHAFREYGGRIDPELLHPDTKK